MVPRVRSEHADLRPGPVSRYSRRRGTGPKSHCCVWRVRTAVAPDGSCVRAVAVNRPVGENEEAEAARRFRRYIRGQTTPPNG